MDLSTVQKTGHWAHGICGCFDNWGVCCLTFWVPCVTFGQSAERLGKSCCLYGCLYYVPGLNCYLLMKQRGHIRGLRDIPGTNMSDFCYVFWLTFWTLTQESQELDHMRLEYFANRPVAAVIVNQPGYPANTMVTTTGYPVTVYGNQQQGAVAYGAPVQQPYPTAAVAEVDYQEKSEKMERQ